MRGRGRIRVVVSLRGCPKQTDDHVGQLLGGEGGLGSGSSSGSGYK